MTAGTDWFDQARRLVESFRAVPADPSDTAGHADGHTAGSDCRWCPLCQAAAVLRGERPEVTAALADILDSTAAALRQFAGEPAAPAGERAEGTAPPDEGRPGPAVQRIDLG